MIDPRAPMRMGLTFDDVLLVPRRTAVTTRADVDLSTRLGARAVLRHPIVSANTPWCTGARMAAALAALGGIGFVHRMCSITAQARAISDTKRTPVPDPARAAVDAAGRLLVGAAVGARDDHLARAAALVEAGADLLVVDVAHGHADYAVRTVEALKARYPGVDLVAGNVATAEGTRDLIEAGADVVKVGIGPGAVCTTRIVTGCGVPQLTAILECAAEARRWDRTVIADGGIRSSGDVVKALAAGASAVMLGSMLAGTNESEAELVDVGGDRFKITTGFVTFGARLYLKRLAGEAVTRSDLKRYVPEGVEATFRYGGPLEDVLSHLLGGIRSGFSYCGALRLAELWEQAEFIQVSPAAVREGRPHALETGPQVHPDYTERLGG